MARIDRYMLSQLLTLFGFFSLILVLIYWVNRAVLLFDRLIADGQSAWVFLELTSLSLPGIIRIVLPLSAFVAAVYVTNRMASESELTVVQATGYSPARLARPAIYFGLIVAALMLMLTHFLVPLSQERLTLRQAEISQNMTARLLTPGEFLTPNENVTFYIRDITPEGEMLDFFISERSNPARRITYTASKAYLVRTDNGPQLVLLDGLSQTLNLTTNRLLTTGFEDFAYDVSSLIDASDVDRRTLAGLSTFELLNPSADTIAEMKRSRAELAVLGHDRFAQALLGFAAGLVGFASLIAGRFSRFGLWRNIAMAVGFVVLLKVLESTGTSLARTNLALWPLVYLAGLTGCALSAGLIWTAHRPALFTGRKRATVTP